MEDQMTEHIADNALLLQKSFEEFTQATMRLQDAYDNLEKKFQQIDLELEKKNQQLKKALAEKEYISSYLTSILESLTTGVVVTDEKGCITLINESAYGFSPYLMGEAKNTGWRSRHFSELFSDVADFEKRSKPNAHMSRCRIQGKAIEISTSSMRTSDTNKRGIIYLLRDVTRLEKLEEMAKRSEKFAAMGELAANIAHEIRNPLGSIELYASLLMKDPAGGRNRNRAYEIIKSVKNVNNKISNLLIFTNRPQPVFKKIKLHDLLDEVVAFVKPIIENENIILNVCYVQLDPDVEGDKEMLKQVFLNLILNALQAMPNGGRLTIETKMTTQCGGEWEKVLPSIEILFDDMGTGIPTETLPRIFDPFFTTKEGSFGLGLAIAHNIIDMHGGIVSAEQNSHGGTAMSIALPVAPCEKIEKTLINNKENDPENGNDA
jgi:PAS domain S-box-containing protein